MREYVGNPESRSLIDLIRHLSLSKGYKSEPKKKLKKKIDILSEKKRKGTYKKMSNVTSATQFEIHLVQIDLKMAVFEKYRT